MMGRQSRQMAMVFVDMASLIPENHLLRKIDGMVSFDFIYGLLAPYYSATGRPSVDPVSCCFSKRMRKFFRKNEKSMLQFCNKNSKRKGRLQWVKKPL